MTPPDLLAGRYEVLRPLGQGAFARTVLAEDRQLGRPVALKILLPRGAADLKHFELFEREAAVLRELRHPGVPAVHATFRAPWEGRDAAVLVMEYIDGTPLAEWIADRRHLDPDGVLHLFDHLLGVLEYLHSRVPPVLHRDIKPANLIVRPDGTAALVDFGAVRNVFRGPDEGGSTVVGTYGYMPYEQYMGQASPASDLYALGATFLHLVTGRAPPEFMSAAGRLEVPAALPGGERFRAVLARLLAPAAGDRFQSAREVRAALLGGGPAAAKGTAAVARRPELSGAILHDPPDLPPAPRPLDGLTRAAYRRAAFSFWAVADTSAKPDDSGSLFDYLLFGFFCLITAGVYPALTLSVWSARRRRLRPFFRDGVPAVARLLGRGEDDSIGFGNKLARLRYEFEADGRLVRGSDQALPTVAERFEPGDPVPILYLPDRGYDSVVVAGW